ncbi:MAG TPA: hypothetical protein VKE98_16365, partial [Gemmataceae bacterium]|nr:hypothetical protein [Gemmataceae bacterium]
KLLGVASPPEKGDYFIDLSRFLKEQLKLESAEEGDRIQEQLRLVTRRPWSAEDYPKLAAWLKANEKPLAVAVEASKRSQYFLPLVSPKTDKGPAGLIGALLPSVQKCREIASALAARALLRSTQGVDDDAWQDLLACHRLGRLIGRGGTLIEGLVGYAIDNVAGRADLAFLERSKANAKRIERWQRDLEKLPPLSTIVEKVDLGERFMFLDSVMMLDRRGIGYLEGLSGGKSKGANVFAEGILRGIDWDPALQSANRWYDRLSLALAEKDRGPREKRLTKIEKELRTLKAETTEPSGMAKLVFGGNSARGRAVGDILVGLLVPAIRKVQSASDRAQQTQENLLLAFALARYQRDQGHHPKELAALAPKYLERISPDLFSGKALIYLPNENGYLLYSVGVNGKDEDGRGYDDTPPGDDLSVRMPLPELRR